MGPRGRVIDRKERPPPVACVDLPNRKAYVAKPDDRLIDRVVVVVAQREPFVRAGEGVCSPVKPVMK